MVLPGLNLCCRLTNSKIKKGFGLMNNLPPPKMGLVSQKAAIFCYNVISLNHINMYTRQTCKKLQFFAFIFFCLFSTNSFLSCQSATESSASIANLEVEKKLEPVIKKIDSLIDAGVIPSASLAITKGDAVIWQQSYGWADIAKKIKASPETTYGLGSLSKSVTATGVMTLAEKGKIDLDDSVNPLIAPAQLQTYVGQADDVKVWHLLNMAAGIPHGWTTYVDRQNTPATDREKDAFLSRIGLITFPPGKVNQYSNYSLGVADLLIERVSKQSLEDYMQQEVFQPLGMNHTYTQHHPERNQEYATFYNSDLEVIEHYDFLPRGGGGFYSSASDLAKYGLFFLKNKVKGQKKILKASTIDLMLNFDRGPESFMGLGWFNTGHSLVSNGRISGAQSMITLVPSEDMAVVCLINASPNGSIADEIVDQIIDLLAPNLEKKLTYEAYAAIYETPYELNDQLAGKWTGNVETKGKKLPLWIDFRADGKVYLKIADEPEQVLENVIFNKFNKLEASCESNIPVPEFTGTEATYTLLSLFLDGENLIGHATPMFSNERGSFCYGAFINLTK